jgi:HD-GYP domain-containing protein (c-di-GMP phosphodiesterase class II)
MDQQAQPVTDAYYFPISPLLLFPQTRGKFGVYLKLNGRYRLYAHPDEPFSDEQRRKLYENGISELYVLTRQRRQFQNYLEYHLGGVLDDESLPMGERARVFYDVSTTIMQETLESRLPGSLDRQGFQRVLRLVTEATRFLGKEGSLKGLAKLISHDFSTYSHSVNVFTYTVAVLQTFGLEEDRLSALGLGAMLHDLGKVAIPRRLLNKPGNLSPAERQEVQEHPLKGVALLALCPLEQEAVNLVLFHHERLDGSGYPAGLKGEQIPLAVKACALTDTYDALTSHRPYAKAQTPYEALSTIRDEMRGQHDPELLKRLVMVLSGAAVI